MLLSGTMTAGSVEAQTVAITGARVHPVSGPVIENGTVLIRDGRIVAVGANVSVPDGARRIDAAGKWVTPGLVYGGTDLGLALMSTGGRSETFESAKTGDVDAAFNVAAGIDPASITFAPALAEGITTALSAPSDGLVAGQAVVIDLVGETVPEQQERWRRQPRGRRAAAARPAGRRAGIPAAPRRLPRQSNAAALRT